MKTGVRPKPLSLQTTDLTEAIERAEEDRAHPVITAVTEGLRPEVAAHIAYKLARKEYSRATGSAKKYNLLRLVEFLPRGIALPAVSTEQLQAFYDASLKKTSGATAHKRLMDAQAFFRWAKEVAKKVRRNPADDVKTVPVPNGARVRFCTVEERDRLINECVREDLKFVLMMGFHCGLRKQEIIQAVPFWFNLAGGHLDMRPTPTMPFNAIKRARTVPLRAVVLEFLHGYKLREPFMLRPDVEAGKDIYRYDFDVALQKHVTACGLPWVTAHVMRHTFASLLVIQNTSIFKVARWLGDSVKTAEKHYAHLAPSDEDIEEHAVRKRVPR